MKPIKGLFIALLLSVTAQSSFAISWMQYSTPELVQKSDMIVVGVATEEKDRIILRASEVLKGEKNDQIVLISTQIGFGDTVTPMGKKGVHFLRRQGAGYAPFHPSCFKNMTELDGVKTVLSMFANPGPYLDLGKYPENPDIVFILGEVFSGWRITSKEIPSLGNSMTRFADKYYEVGPWSNDATVTLECETDANGAILVTSSQPSDPLGIFLKHRLAVASRWPYVKSALKPRFSVTLDARIPERIGSAESTEALEYLRARLRSDDREVVTSALLALAKIRDGRAVSLVVPLLQNKDRQVQVKAIQFLGWSRSKFAAKPLCKLLDAHSDKYPKNHDLSDPTAVALKKIGNRESLDSLEQAACRGVQRAIEAIGAIGRTESFEIMLKAAKRDPRRCAYMVDAFYWLVRRSNKETKDWMYNSTWSVDIGVAKMSKWAEWWDSNGNDFKVTKSQQEAIEEMKKQTHNKTDAGDGK